MSDLTSRACGKCGAIFPVGKEPTERSDLDRHCGQPTTPCPTIDGEWIDRVKAYREHFAGHAVAQAQPVNEKWWE